MRTMLAALKDIPLKSDEDIIIWEGVLEFDKSGIKRPYGWVKVGFRSLSDGFAKRTSADGSCHVVTFDLNSGRANGDDQKVMEMILEDQWNGQLFVVKNKRNMARTYHPNPEWKKIVRLQSYIETMLKPEVVAKDKLDAEAERMNRLIKID